MPKRCTTFPWVFGLAHAALDAATVAATLCATKRYGFDPSLTFTLVVSYDLLAFAGQAVLGAVIDRVGLGRGWALSGLALAALGVVAVDFNPWLVLLCAGLGNALFHVGAGAMSLEVDRGKAWAPGVFVAPGALGLTIGLTVGRGGAFVYWPFTLALAAAFTACLFAPTPQVAPQPRVTPPGMRLPGLVVVLLLVSVAVRAFVGSAGSFACPKSAALPVVLTAAAVLGKGAGGWLADRFGWIRIAVGALLVSAPLIALGGASLPLLGAGMLLFQMTMPVTLTAVYNVLRGRPALSFGLACLALVGGAIPTYLHTVRTHFSAWLLLVAILASAAALALALRELARVFACGPVIEQLNAARSRGLPRNS